MDLDVKGYVLKESAVTDILDAVRTVLAGHRYGQPHARRLLVHPACRRRGPPGREDGLDRLTPAERRILKLIAEDKTSKEIAQELGLSPRTVENHRTNICAQAGRARRPWPRQVRPRAQVPPLALSAAA